MAKTLPVHCAPTKQLSQICYTYCKVKANPLAAPHVAVFEGLRTECLQVHATDLTLIEAQADAQARVDVANESLSGLATRYSRGLLNITGDNRSNPTYLFFFGEEPLADFKRPVLARKLTKMAKWIPALQDAHPSLQAMGPELIAAVAAGEAAATAKEEAIQARRHFREVGAWRQLTDRHNAVRKEVHGALAKLPHEHPTLPTNFADQFFRRDTSRPEVEEAETLSTEEAVHVHMKALRADMAAAEERLSELQAEAKAEAEAAEARARQEETVAELDRALAELQAKRAAALAELDAG